LTNPNNVKVTVSSLYGSPDPQNGVHSLTKGSSKTISVKSPHVEDNHFWKFYWKKVWTCTGWSGKGDIPPSGVGTSVTFEDIEQDSTITFNWEGGHLGPQVLSLVLVIALFSLGLLSYLSTHALVTSISAGALGGLGHEIVQSGGKYVLPNTDQTGDFCLGGLMGIISGGTAGLLTYQGLLTKGPITVSTPLVVTALIAGLAVKALADTPNPTQK
jgi:hypothetical protein